MIRARRLKAVVAVCVLLGAGACAILDSDRINQYAPDECVSSLGHYYLPKRFLVAEVTQAQGARPVLDLKVTDSHADGRYKYCLAFYGSPLAEDSVAVERYVPSGTGAESRGLLQRVRSQAVDRTKEVIETVIDTVATGITGGEFTHRDAIPRLAGSKLLNRTFDPFDPAQLTSVNTELAEFGYCIKFDAARRGNPAFATGCGRAAHMYVKAEPDPWKVTFLHTEVRRGIFYRPNLQRKFVVLQNSNPDGAGTWREIRDYNFLMPNEAPIFSVEVNRSLFVTRKTELIFDQGSLRDVIIDKPSELATAVEIPLRIVEVVVAIPAQIVKVRINSTNNRAQIIAAQQKLLEVQAQRKGLEEQLAEKQKALAPFAPLIPPSLTDPLRGGPSLGSPEALARANARCGVHCSAPENLPRLSDPPNCPRTCSTIARQCLVAGAQPTEGDCVTLGIKATFR